MSGNRIDTGFLLQAASKLIGRLEARLLLQDVTGLTATRLAAHPEYPVENTARAHYLDLVARRERGEPLAYLLGRREFYGRDFHVAPGVLIPRPETELLVETGLKKIANQVQPDVLDLGCGSGCIAISLALERPDAAVTAIDASPAALAIARKNARRLDASVDLIESDWFAALNPQKKFKLIVSNPPYIACADPHLVQGDLRYEPETALASGNDGLDALRHLIRTAPRHLQAGGWLLVEHGYDQADAVRELLESAGFFAIEQHADLAGILRVSGGCYSPNLFADPIRRTQITPQ